MEPHYDFKVLPLLDQVPFMSEFGAFQKDFSDGKTSWTPPFYLKSARKSSTNLPEITQVELKDLRAEVLEVAQSFGFPASLKSEDDGKGKNGPEFDRAISKIVYTSLPLPLSEARQAEAWNFLSAAVFFDIIAWRWSGLTENRFNGKGEKSTFKRLWWREYVLDDQSRMLIEDSTVQLLERTEISGNRQLAYDIAREYLNQTSNLNINRQDSFRYVMLQFTAKSNTISLASLESKQRHQMISEWIRNAIESFQKSQASESNKNKRATK